MITHEQAMNADFFHANGCTFTAGPRGGSHLHVEMWRRNGRTQTWKREPDRFRIPIKHGMYAYGSIVNWNADLFHTPDECPALREEAAHIDRQLTGIATMRSDFHTLVVDVMDAKAELEAELLEDGIMREEVMS